MEEGRITFVRLRHQYAAGAKAGITAKTLHQATDDKGRIVSRGIKQGSHEARRGGLPVGSGYGNAVAVAHELPQHLRPRHHWDARLPGCGKLGIVRPNSRGHDHHIGAGDMLRRLPKLHRRP